jgi:hypothetical protein
MSIDYGFHKPLHKHTYFLDTCTSTGIHTVGCVVVVYRSTSFLRIVHLVLGEGPANSSHKLDADGF